MKQTLAVSLAAVVLLPVAALQAGTTLNYDPALPMPAPVLNAGWASDGVGSAFSDSYDSPYVYNLGSPATLTVTDAYIAGDNYTVYDFGNPILTTSIPGGPGTPTGDPDAAIADGGFSWGSVVLGPGAHSLTIQADNGTGIFPAGFFTRLDGQRTPDAGATGLLLGSALFALGALRRKQA